jgi:excisionase family DNA binding protein
MLYRTTAAAARLGIGKTKLFELLSTGELASVSLGSNRLVADVDLDDYEARLRAQNADETRVDQLRSLVDEAGRLDVNHLPPGTTLADLEALKLPLRRGTPTSA